MQAVFLFTALTAVKVPFTDQEDDLKTGYTPVGARSYDEFAAYERFYDNQGGEPLAVLVFVRAAGPGNRSMHGAAELNETVQLLDKLGKGFPLAGRSFYSLCTDFCAMNEPVRQFRVGAGWEKCGLGCS